MQDMHMCIETAMVMSTITDDTQTYCFSIQKPQSIWDDSQWSEKYLEGDIPDKFKSAELETFIKYVSEDRLSILKSIRLLNK